MKCQKLFAGLSFIALAASAASAQTSTNQSEITQTGDDNKANVDNARPGNDNNKSTIVQIGNANSVTVLQVGDLNISSIREVGNSNQALHTQDIDLHTADTVQNGNLNRSAVRQRGELNRATVAQDGNRNLSQLSQGVEFNATTDFNGTTFFDPTIEGAGRAADDNRATVRQIGNDLSSTIRQRAAAGGRAADDNVAAITQRGQFNAATILQESRGNSASVFQFDGGSSSALGNSVSVTQRDSAATTGNPESKNVADVAVSSRSNSATVVQNGRDNVVRLSAGIGESNIAQVTQVGNAGQALVGQYGVRDALEIGQNSSNARGYIWQQITSRDSSATIQQGTGASGTAGFSGAYFGESAPTGAATSALSASIVQGNPGAEAAWNVAQILQDGTGLSATIEQRGSGTAALPNIVRVAQQGGTAGGNSATAIQRAGVGPSSAADTAPTGQTGDEYFFAGGARSAEIVILQSGSGNSATVEQRGRGQLARIEQGPGSGNVASILQDVGAVNATAIIRQTGNNNSYSVNQPDANLYILVSQTGNNNAVTDVVERGN
jgi:hypothetical protein